MPKKFYRIGQGILTEEKGLVQLTSISQLVLLKRLKDIQKRSCTNARRSTVLSLILQLVFYGLGTESQTKVKFWENKLVLLGKTNEREGSVQLASSFSQLALIKRLRLKKALVMQGRSTKQISARRSIVLRLTLQLVFHGLGTEPQKKVKFWENKLFLLWKTNKMDRISTLCLLSKLACFY